MRWPGIYSGTVVDNADGLKRGRVRVNVPVVFGPVPDGNVAVADLPWALPAGLPAGQTDNSGGMMWIPAVNDRVFVMFLDGEPEKPVWIWGMADTDATSTFFDYAASNTTAPESTPDVATQVSGGNSDSVLPSGTASAGAPKPLVRLKYYKQDIEFSPFGLIFATSGGYGLVLTDSSPNQYDGSITLYTPLQGFIDLTDDPTGPSAGTTLTIQAQNAYVNILQEWTHMAQTVDFIINRAAAGTMGAPTSSVDSSPSLKGLTTEQAGSLNTTVTPFGIQSDRIVLGYRTAAPATSPGYIPPVAAGTTTLSGVRGSAPQLDPISRVSDMDAYTTALTTWLDQQLGQALANFFTELKTSFDSHTHATAFGPTSAPLPLQPAWKPVTPNSQAYLKQQQVPTGSPTVFAVKAGK